MGPGISEGFCLNRGRDVKYRDGGGGLEDGWIGGVTVARLPQTAARAHYEHRERNVEPRPSNVVLYPAVREPVRLTGARINTGRAFDIGNEEGFGESVCSGFESANLICKFDFFCCTKR